MNVWEDPHLVRSSLAQPFFKFYRGGRIGNFMRRKVMKLESGEMYSATLRHILYKYHKLEVGAYSYGPWYDPVAFLNGLSVGRYVSIAAGVRVVGANHPMNHLSTHPFFFNPDCGIVKESYLNEDVVMRIEHDAWIGANALFTPRCTRVGVGAVVGGGAVVTRDVPDFAIVVGNPAKIIKYRFEESVQKAILASKWWEHSIDECKTILPAMTQSLDISTHPFFKNVNIE